jgi:hypothetical protein
MIEHGGKPHELVSGKDPISKQQRLSTRLITWHLATNQVLASTLILSIHIMIHAPHR